MSSPSLGLSPAAAPPFRSERMTQRVLSCHSRDALLYARMRIRSMLICTHRAGELCSLHVLAWLQGGCSPQVAQRLLRRLSMDVHRDSRSRLARSPGMLPKLFHPGRVYDFEWCPRYTRSTMSRYTWSKMGRVFGRVRLQALHLLLSRFGRLYHVCLYFVLCPALLALFCLFT
jgi:hypothetical protein